MSTIITDADARDVGRPSYYRPKERTLQLRLTTRASDTLEALHRRKNRSRSDIVEQLIRKYGRLVNFPEEPK